MADLDANIVNKANESLIRQIRIRLFFYRLPSIVVACASLMPGEIVGLIAAVAFVIVSETLIRMVCRYDLYCINALRARKYVLIQDVLVSMRSVDIHEGNIDKASHYVYFLTFKNTRAVFQTNDANRYKNGKDVVLQIIQYREEEIILNVFNR